MLFYFFILVEFVASRVSDQGINKRWQENSNEGQFLEILLYQGFPHVLNGIQPRAASIHK
jgi:hypothetical protein